MFTSSSPLPVIVHPSAHVQHYPKCPALFLVALHRLITTCEVSPVWNSPLIHYFLATIKGILYGGLYIYWAHWSMKNTFRHYLDTLLDCINQMCRIVFFFLNKYINAFLWWIHVMLSIVSLSFPHHHTNTPPVSSSPGGVGEWSLWAGARTRLTGVLDIVGLEWDVVGAEEQVW